MLHLNEIAVAEIFGKRDAKLRSPAALSYAVGEECCRDLLGTRDERDLYIIYERAFARKHPACEESAQ